MLKKIALLVIDMQEGLLQRQVFHKEDLIKNINLLLTKFHAQGEPVFFFQHTNDSFLKADTSEWQISAELNRSHNDRVLQKTNSSVFKDGKLLSMLKSEDIQSVVIVGLVSNGCVQVACIDSKKAGLDTKIISDGHSTFHKDAEKVISDWNVKLENEGIVVITAEKFLNN